MMWPAHENPLVRLTDVCFHIIYFALIYLNRNGLEANVPPFSNTENNGSLSFIDQSNTFL